MPYFKQQISRKYEITFYFVLGMSISLILHVQVTVLPVWLDLKLNDYNNQHFSTVHWTAPENIFIKITIMNSMTKILLFEVYK
jgi:glycopeptide antibiotics resistance protein